MSQSHAVRQKRQDRPPDPVAKERSTHLDQPEEAKQDLGTYRNKRSTPPVTSSLFQSDPEENVRLWMEKFFPGIVLSREEAIRQWLARPPEFRVQSFPETPANNERTSISDTPVEVAPNVTIEVPPNQRAVENSNDRTEHAPRSEQAAHTEQAPQVIPIGASLQTDRSRKLPRLLFRLAAFSVLAFVIIKLLWAIPMTHVFPHADAAIPAPKSHDAETVAVAIVPESKRVEENARQSAVAPKPDDDTATQPSRIESVSIGCKETQPCIVISMSGKENVPKLSVLTNPDRLIVDFQASAYYADVHHIAVGRGAVKAVRIGRSTGDKPPNTRVVIDLVAQCDYELNTLTNKYIVNIYPKGTTRQQE